jgi:hypothetical protein
MVIFSHHIVLLNGARPVGAIHATICTNVHPVAASTGARHLPAFRPAEE